MHSTRRLKSSIIYVACLVLASFYPISVYAEEPVPAEATQAETPADPAPSEQPASEPAPSDEPAEEPETYSYDASTGRWNTSKWEYDPASNTYVPAKPKEAPAVAPAQNSKDSTSKSETKVDLANALDSIAKTGDANVTGNNTAGGAATGNASAAATIVNNVNSSMTNANNKEAATFVTDIMGDVNGDIMLQPMLLKAMLEANAANNGNTSISSHNKTSVSNDVDLAAQSGNANVSSNTKAGDATTGNADTILDIVNLVNSMVAANQSFMGTINIYGNLNGDILIAPDFIPQMLASNKGSSTGGGSTVVNSRDTQEIVNNVSLAAESGAALVDGNTNGGSATTGDANTNLVIFNLSGHDIVAANSLLVFVNVLGTWVGVIVDAPEGATAAAIGNDVEKNDLQPNLVIDADNDTAITNNVKLTSRSGNAAVTNNTQAGNARTGNATASANIANISNSSLGLTGWFGVLFINVFGNWHGSFGVDTEAGNQPVSTGSGNPEVIRFIPSEARTSRSVNRLRVVDPGAATSQAEVQQAAADTTGVLGTDDVKSDIPTQQSYIDARPKLNIPLMAASLLLVVISGYVLRRFLF